MSRTPASSDRRIEILKSAAAAFRRRGYHGASVDEIASALEMTKGNLYYYFKNKEEILFACHEYSLDKLLTLMADVQAESASPESKLRRQPSTRMSISTIIDGCTRRSAIGAPVHLNEKP